MRTKPAQFPSSRRSAFTLIEIILVLSIIALLLGVGIANLDHFFGGGMKTKTRADISALGTALKGYKMEVGRYPTTEQGLGALQVKPMRDPRPRSWSGPYMEVFPRDPWDNPYRYRFPGTRNALYPDLFSSGKDGEVGSDDDVWPEHVQDDDVPPWEERKSST